MTTFVAPFTPKPSRWTKSSGTIYPLPVGIKWFDTYPKRIYPKDNVIAQLVFEISDFIHYATDLALNKHGGLMCHKTILHKIYSRLTGTI